VTVTVLVAAAMPGGVMIWRCVHNMPPWPRPRAAVPAT
jgi:hypothetical protein